MPNFIRNLRKNSSGLPPVGDYPTGVILLNTADQSLAFPNAAGTDWIVLTGSASSPSFALTQDTFTGTGAQTAFTTSSTDSTDAHFIVAVGGVMQTAGTDYTVANGIVTFATAPASGEKVNVLVASGGVAGAQGPAGATGATGPVGATGAGASGVGIEAYSAGQTYHGSHRDSTRGLL